MYYDAVDLYALALCGSVYTPPHGAGWVLLEPCSVIGDVYLGITSGLTQLRGMLGAWRGLLQRVKLCECVISWWGYPS